MGMARSICVVALCAMLGTTPASVSLARGSEEHWLALSTTAMGITGDILLSPTRLKAGGHVFPLEVVHDLPNYGAYFGPVEARVLRITRRMNPKLLSGNRLGCGSPINWVVVYHIDHNTLGMDVFGGSLVPTSSRSSGFCSLYTYTRH